MEGLLEIIDINDDWLKNNIKENNCDNYFNLMSQYTQLTTKYYNILYPNSIIYPYIFTFGDFFAYENMSIIYRKDTNKYCLFKYFVNGDKFTYLTDPKTWPIEFDK